ncbi:ABC transporter permease [Methanobacterium alcaliphilum]|uniref:ABC transporter permease n=1 Tax=Methanobacterium alcaliphilum TaxID=392018 RepID=UPI00200A52C1|nr:ABC transporter permease [Methanobacterium alcaliphilum]MCK9151259.1 ABC transporter permease [Methanobacterium alcaliphilum]
MKKILISLILPVSIIIIWAILTSFTGMIPSYFLPSPYDVLISFETLLVNGQLIQDTSLTLMRVLLGLTVSAMVGIPLGILIGWSSAVNNLTDLTIGILRPIPPIAWIPFSILWFGVGLESAIFIIFVGSVFPILINTMDGVKRVDKVLLESAYTLGASETQTLWKVVVPASLPSIVTGLKIGVGVGLMCTVAAEMIGSNSGLGYLIFTSTSMLDTASAIVGMLIIGSIGLGADFIFSRIEKEVNW